MKPRKADVSVDSDRGLISMTWDIDDALQVGYVLQSAGMGPQGIKDQGFFDDGTALLDAVWEYQDRED